MGRLSREAGGLGDYSENANDNETPEPEAEPELVDDSWPVMDLPPADEDEPA